MILIIDLAFAINFLETVFALFAIILRFDELETIFAFDTGGIVDKGFVSEAIGDIIFALVGKIKKEEQKNEHVKLFELI